MLGAFQRVHVPAGKTLSVTLAVRPETHAVVTGPDTHGDAVYNMTAQHVVEAGAVELYVGGGQPDHYPGALAALVTVKSTSPLHLCKE